MAVSLWPDLNVSFFSRGHRCAQEGTDGLLLRKHWPHLTIPSLSWQCLAASSLVVVDGQEMHQLLPDLPRDAMTVQLNALLLAHSKSSVLFSRFDSLQNLRTCRETWLKSPKASSCLFWRLGFTEWMTSYHISSLFWLIEERITSENSLGRHYVLCSTAISSMSRAADALHKHNMYKDANVAMFQKSTSNCTHKIHCCIKIIQITEHYLHCLNTAWKYMNWTFHTFSLWHLVFPLPIFILFIYFLYVFHLWTYNLFSSSFPFAFECVQSKGNSRKQTLINIKELWDSLTI